MPPISAEHRSLTQATFVAVLDVLTVAVLLVAPDLRLVHANLAGAALIRSGDPLGIHRGRITAPSAVTATIKLALAAPSGGIGRPGLGVPARRSDGEEMVLHLLPLRAEGLPGPAVALFASPAAPPPAPLAAVAALFDLTPAEAQVLGFVGAGRTVAEVAQATGVAPATVKTHLLRLFDKTRTHRQAELVALLASFSLPIGCWGA